MAKKKGFMSRLIEGPERSENYARSTLPSNRWQLGWDIFKTNFGKIVLLNIILLLFALPIILLIVYRSGLITYVASQIPFDSFMSYPYIGSLNGAEETVLVQVNSQTLIFLPIGGIILSVGLAGVLYILRNMVWTEGIFVGSDFWRGVKNNFWIVMLTVFVYSIFLLLGIFSLTFSDYLIATGQGSVVLFTIAKVITYISMVFFSLMAMHMLTMSVTYELSFFKLVKNAFILTISLLPTNVFFIAFALASALLALIIPMIGWIVVVLFGASAGLLIWTVYSHWIYDKFINEKVPGAKRNRGIYTKVGKDSFGEDLDDETTFDTAYVNRRPVKPITDYDVEIVELPTSFTREDLRRLEESKEAMRKDSDQYVEDVLSGKINPDEPIVVEKTEEEDINIEEFLKEEEGDETAENTK